MKAMRSGRNLRIIDTVTSAELYQRTGQFSRVGQRKKEETLSPNTRIDGSMVDLRFHRALLLSLIIFSSGCLGSSDSVDEGLGPFPEFSATADDGLNYSNADVDGQPFIVLFSAEWCNTPCHQIMHQIYDVLQENVTVLVMSTDPVEDITLEEWHDDSNDYDDAGGDTANTLPWPYMKAVDAAAELDVKSRPNVYFVDDAGYIQALNEGSFDSDDEVREMYALIS